MSRGINNNEDNNGNFFDSMMNEFLLQRDMMKGLIQMADMQYTIYLRFLELTNNKEAAEQQTFIFMKALNAGNKKDNNEE